MILVINGSPQIEGNLHRMLRFIAEGKGYDAEYVHLPSLDIAPCRACLGCVESQRCVVLDGMTGLYDKIEECDAYIVGSPTYFRHINGFTHTFLERMFPLRHLAPGTIGKPAVAVAVGNNNVENAINEITYNLSHYYYFDVVATAGFISGIPPCYSCGYGTECRYGGPARAMSPEEFDNFSEITPDLFRRFEDDPDVVAACERAAAILRSAIA